MSSFCPMPRDWHEWHRAYDTPGSPLAMRLEIVHRNIRTALDAMPPAESHLSLSDDEKALLVRWVSEGADYRPHWSSAPVSRESPPATKDASNPIDAFVRARLEAEGLDAAPVLACSENVETP